MELQILSYKKSLLKYLSFHFAIIMYHHSEKKKTKEKENEEIEREEMR
jgi:hypothetical protein